MTDRTLVLVSGATCTGKTTVSARLAEVLCCPAIRKDDIKERLCEVLGCADIAESRRLGGAAWELLYVVLDQILPYTPLVLAEGNFYGLANERVRELVERHGCGTVEVHLRTERAVWARQVLERAHDGRRHAAHFDWLRLEGASEAELAPGRDAEPMRLGGVLIEVDTTDFDAIDYEGLVTQIRSSTAVESGRSGAR